MLHASHYANFICVTYLSLETAVILLTTFHWKETFRAKSPLFRRSDLYHRTRQGVINFKMQISTFSTAIFRPTEGSSLENEASSRSSFPKILVTCFSLNLASFSSVSRNSSGSLAFYTQTMRELPEDRKKGSNDRFVLLVPPRCYFQIPFYSGKGPWNSAQTRLGVPLASPFLSNVRLSFSRRTSQRNWFSCPFPSSTPLDGGILAHSAGKRRPRTIQLQGHGSIDASSRNGCDPWIANGITLNLPLERILDWYWRYENFSLDCLDRSEGWNLFFFLWNVQRVDSLFATNFQLSATLRNFKCM